MKKDAVKYIEGVRRARAEQNLQRIHKTLCLLEGAVLLFLWALVLAVLEG